MRRSVSRLLGLILLVAMIAGQASITVLAQGTPAATPAASPGAGGPPGVQIETLAYTENVGPEKNLDLLLMNFTLQVGSSLPQAEALPSALFEVDSGYIRVTQSKGENVWVKIGKNGTPITTGDGKQTVCTIDNSKDGWCQLKDGQWDVIVGPGSTISLKNSTFTVQAVEQPAALQGFNTGSAPVKGFQGGGAASGKGSVLQQANACWICPRPY